jgi:hypothetical protein
MPAAATLVHPADAVDGEFFNLDFFQNSGIFLTRFFGGLFLFRFHCYLLFTVSFCPPLWGVVLYLVNCNSDAKLKHRFISVFLPISLLNQHEEPL